MGRLGYGVIKMKNCPCWVGGQVLGSSHVWGKANAQARGLGPMPLETKLMWVTPRVHVWGLVARGWVHDAHGPYPKLAAGP